MPAVAKEAPNQETLKLYEFGPFRLDPAERKLLRGNEMVALTPKAFDTLHLLVRNSGHLLEKDELIRMLWPDTFVEEGSLSNNIFLLRKALGEDPAFIETVPRRGYRFVGAVRQFPRAAPTSTKPLASIAVLPFLFLNEVEERKALSLGFADALITMLGSLEDIVVLPTSAILNCAPSADPAQVCRDLGVRYTLQGSVQKLGTQWRVSIQLFDATAQKITFSEKHDFRLDNVFDVQDEIGRQIVESLQSRFPLAVPKSRDRYSSVPEAYDEFMSGLRESYSDQEEVLRSATQHLFRAVHRDPEFALAHATLSYVSMNIHFEYDPQHASLERAEHHCCRALSLDPALPEGHLARRGSCGARRRISSTLMPSRRWNRFSQCGPILSGPITGCPRFVPISDGFKKRASPTSRRSDRIQRLGPLTSRFFISIAGTSRAQKKQQKPTLERDRGPNMRSVFTHYLRFTAETWIWPSNGWRRL